MSLSRFSLQFMFPVLLVPFCISEMTPTQLRLGYLKILSYPKKLVSVLRSKVFYACVFQFYKHTPVHCLAFEADIKISTVGLTL